MRSQGLVSVYEHVPRSEEENSFTNQSEAQPRRSQRRKRKKITLLPPSSPSRPPKGRPSSYTNWFADGLFPPILEAMREAKGNLNDCLRILNRRHRNGLTKKSPYSSLSRGTLASWFHPRTKKLLPHVSQYAVNESPYGGRKKLSIFGSIEVVEALKDLVVKQRGAGKLKKLQIHHK
jgi:hypothetical protein